MAETATETTIAEELKSAAMALRDAAKIATRGPWVPYPTITADQHDEAWTITRTWCDQDPCEKDCGHTVLKTGAEGCEEDNIRGEDAAWICLVNPLLAEPLAVWLEEFADWAARSIEPRERDEDDEVMVHESEYCDGEIGKNCQCFDRALAVARVLNGTTPQEVVTHA